VTLQANKEDIPETSVMQEAKADSSDEDAKPEGEALVQKPEVRRRRIFYFFIYLFALFFPSRLFHFEKLLL
jgi:hypothetical protein